MSINSNRMPDGENNSAIRSMQEQGVRSGVTDTYGADLTKGYDTVSEKALPSPGNARMEGC